MIILVWFLLKMSEKKKAIHFLKYLDISSIWYKHTFLHFSEFLFYFFLQKSYGLVDCVECKAVANIYLNQTRN